MKEMKMMSENFIENPYGLLGLVIVIVAYVIIFFINRGIGRKKRLFDERYYLIANGAKARYMDEKLVIYMISWFVVIIFDGISFSFYLLTTLYVLHNITLIITTTYFSKEY